MSITPHLKAERLRKLLTLRYFSLALVNFLLDYHVLVVLLLKILY